MLSHLIQDTLRMLIFQRKMDLAPSKRAPSKRAPSKMAPSKMAPSGKMLSKGVMAELMAQRKMVKVMILLVTKL